MSKNHKRSLAEKLRSSANGVTVLAGLTLSALFVVPSASALEPTGITGARSDGNRENTVANGAKGKAVPIGTVQAWNVRLEYAMDVAKLAKEAGGEIVLVKRIAPSISRGNSQNQEISTTLEADGKFAKVMKADSGEEVLVLRVNKNSGIAHLKLEGQVYNRNMTTRGNETSVNVLSPEARKKFTSSNESLYLEDPYLMPNLKKLGLIKKEGESASAFADRVCVWMAKNLEGKSGADKACEMSPAQAVCEKYVNCNGASKVLNVIFRRNGIPTKINPRTILEFDGKSWDWHSDISIFLEDKNSWIGISGAGLVSGDKKIVTSRGTAKGTASFGLDVDTGYGGPLIDMAEDTGQVINIPDLFNRVTNYNDQRVYWQKVGSDSVGGKVDPIVTHQVKEISLKNRER